MTVAGYVELTLKFEREGSKWVGTCLELGASTYARTLEKVHENLLKLVPEHLDLLEEAGERDRFFDEHGIKFHLAKPKPREVRIPNTGADLSRGVTGPLFQPGVFQIEKPQATLAGV